MTATVRHIQGIYLLLKNIDNEEFLILPHLER